MKLTEADRDAVHRYLLREPSFNLFMIGDVEVYGLEQEFLEVWSWGELPHRPAPLLMRYYQNGMISADEGDDLSQVFAFIRSTPSITRMSSRRWVIDAALEHLPAHKVSRQIFAELQPGGERLGDPETAVQGGVEDAAEVFALRKKVKEFAVKDSMYQGFRKSIEDGMSRIYVARDGGRVVAVAQTTAENSASAMVVGVCTDPAYRRRGLATACMNALCRDLLADGKNLCLFYDNPNAGEIYRRLGFREIGDWGMLEIDETKR